MEKGRGKGTDTLQTDNVFTRKEYIEREAVLSLVKDICVLTKWDTEYHHRSIDPIDVRELPAADVVPVRHGRWIVDDFTGIIKCSECDNDAPLETTGGEQWRSPFCPLCGALMDKDGDGDV